MNRKFENYDPHECQRELREKLVMVEEIRDADVPDKPARQVATELHEMIKDFTLHQTGG